MEQTQTMVGVQTGANHLKMEESVVLVPVLLTMVAAAALAAAAVVRTTIWVVVAVEVVSVEVKVVLSLA